jgi:replicative DNA helicase
LADPGAQPSNSAGLASVAPPHDEEAEASVLGAIMLADRWFDTITVDVHLNPSDFYRPRNRVIFQAMLELNSDSEAIDTLTVSARLTETGKLDEAGGKDYIETLVTRIPALGNTKQYGQIVKENSLLRGLVRASQDIQASVNSREGDPRELLERAQQRVFEVAQDSQSGELVKLSEILHEEIDALEQQSLHGNAVTGTPTGFRDVDELTGGLQGGNLIIIAARPSMGKSALVTNIAENAALKGYPVAIFSLEMSKTELSQRFLASQAKLSGDAMRKGQIKKNDWPKVLEAAQAFDDAPLWIDDSSDINIIELRAKARRLHGRFLGQENEGGKKGLGLIIVDYLQLLRANDGRESRVEQVAQMSRGLKILARELDVPVIAVSQLSRAVESRQPPRPQLSDLRECVTGDTLVQLADGSRAPIASLIGDEHDVLAFDEGSHAFISARCDAIWEVGERATIRVRLEQDRELVCTPDHLILTREGWQKAGALIAGASMVRCRALAVAQVPGASEDSAPPPGAPSWAAVESIEEAGVTRVYDLTVPGPENWIANDGIVTHNSGQIEQDADVVAFIYREEYYLREDSERPGIADIIFAKHRNGPVGDVELTFLHHYPKFTNKPKGYSEGGSSDDRYQAATVSGDEYVEEVGF